MRVSRSETDWFSLVEAWQSSGLSQSEFCKSKKLSPSSFYNWQIRYRKKHPDRRVSGVFTKIMAPSPRFIEIANDARTRLSEEDNSRVLKIKTSYGWSVELPL